MDLPDCGRYSYASKSRGSKVIYSRTGASKRHSTVSKSDAVSNFTYGADSRNSVSHVSDVKSLLSKKNVDRFNENFEETGKEAILSSKHSKLSVPLSGASQLKNSVFSIKSRKSVGSKTGSIASGLSKTSSFLNRKAELKKIVEGEE